MVGKSVSAPERLGRKAKDIENVDNSAGCSFAAADICMELDMRVQGLCLGVHV
jgi:hypothetical protein